MDDFTKIIRPGTIDTGAGRRASIFCKAEYRGGRLSITGVEGPLANGNALGGAGQIDMTLGAAGGLDTFQPAEGWTLEGFQRFLALWDRWHLNDMRAGSAEQEAWLRANPVPAGTANHYEQACITLASAGLNPDASGYHYGTAWKREDVPEDVLQEIVAMPDADRKPA